ncbi:DUF4259 domain-containing protein [Paenibacillus barcinonensis]|uniref:DUF4259 domain-containing protein n=1 Tax=Paenibacillus TaxID=44249 RepID=UPI001C117726|nr:MULTISPECIES: DUF4259 domain-containing protein [Paenibacillus]MBU5353851.1 DUF4259 domain-containing protein [Paenibacillus barcinonensis]MDM5279166.1 DUF4259 domain-containing protein [Paenibacillus silvae]
MGAWGTGIFENDDVLDWKADLLDSDGIDFIEETIEEVLEDEYIESDLASNALGAIEILAALQGRPGKEILNNQSNTGDLYDWINTNKGKGKKLISKAKRAVKKIKKDSELKELWEESEEYPIWLNTINDLENRL